MKGRDLIEWIRKNHAEDMVVHVRNTDGRVIDGETPEITVFCTDGEVVLPDC